MTREEAITIIDNLHLIGCGRNQHENDLKINIALDMAIEALKILGDDGIVNCCGCIHWKTDGGAMMMCELWNTPMGDFDYCSYGKREKPTIPCFAESAEAGWIPCSERLPEKDEVVLITNGKGNVRCGQYRSEHDVRDGTHYWWWKGKTVETVLAWMPLPEPYREDGEA
jgi:hypothetical protein